MTDHDEPFIVAMVKGIRPTTSVWIEIDGRGLFERHPVLRPVDTRLRFAASLQLSMYSLAFRDARILGAPERATPYFAESALRLSTTRTDEQLDLARADVLARVSRMRAGKFGATPGDACRYCDYARMCPERVP